VRKDDKVVELLRLVGNLGIEGKIHPHGQLLILVKPGVDPTTDILNLNEHKL
jgi:hypothetical protein